MEGWEWQSNACQAMAGGQKVAAGSSFITKLLEILRILIQTNVSECW